MRNETQGKNRIVGINCASDFSQFLPVPLRVASVPIWLNEVEQERRSSGNGDRKAIVVGAGFCDGKGELAHTVYAPH